METLYNVKADHPVLQRIDKYGLTALDADELVKELKKYNYENITVDHYSLSPHSKKK